MVNRVMKQQLVCDKSRAEGVKCKDIRKSTVRDPIVRSVTNTVTRRVTAPTAELRQRKAKLTILTVPFVITVGNLVMKEAIVDC